MLLSLINDLYKNIELYNQGSSLEDFENLKMKYKEWIEHTVNHFATEEEEIDTIVCVKKHTYPERF